MEHDIPFSGIPSLNFYDVASESPLLNESGLQTNIECIDADIECLKKQFFYQLSIEEITGKTNIKLPIDWPTLDPSSGPYANLCHGLNLPERILLLFSLLPHYAPEVLREIVSPVQEGLIIKYPHVGGFIKRTSFQFFPNLQTVLFACAGISKKEQQLCYRQLMMQGELLKRQIITLRPFDHSESVFTDKELIPELVEEYVHFLLQGRQPRPDFGKNFPAKLLTTDKTWDQLVLGKQTKREIELLIDWVNHGQALSNESKGYFGPGYPALFFGPPGTGKSMTAALIGQRCGLNVFRVDASRIVSKYIGETEKNLVLLFQRMKLDNARQEKKSILFFDEADVLFSKRTEVKDAKDKWANMETSVLLPLVEEYDGLVIVATNLVHNIDEAMDRRFQLKIKFPALGYAERIHVFEKGLPPAYSYPKISSASQLARYKLSPASIMNVLKGSCLQARKRGSYIVTGKDMEYYLALEFSKSGLTPSWDNIPVENTSPFS